MWIFDPGGLEAIGLVPASTSKGLRGLLLLRHILVLPLLETRRN